jgi:putative ABC transport system permease protein
MTLKDIALLNLRRRKAKAAFLLAGLLIGVTTVVALMTLVDAMREDITDKLDKFGANILIVPKTENLSLTYGGLSLGGVSFEMEEIHTDQLDNIGSIKNAANVAAVGPVALGVVEVSDKKVLLSGVNFEASHILKPWWNVQGDLPTGDQVILGSEAAMNLGLNIGDTFTANDRELTVTGLLDPTGSQDDQIIFTPHHRDGAADLRCSSGWKGHGRPVGGQGPHGDAGAVQEADTGRVFSCYPGGQPGGARNHDGQRP